jgi:hypothetical protein
MSRRSGIRFADKDMRQHEKLQRMPCILDHSVIQYARGCAVVATGFGERVSARDELMAFVNGSTHPSVTGLA